MNSGAAQVFVYYRIRAVDAALAIAAVTAFQARLRASMPGLAASLSRRVDADAELPTLMETYSRTGVAGNDWQRDVEGQANEALAAWIVGARHVEVFVPCA